MAQAKTNLSGIAKETIANLDIDACIENVRNDQEAHMERYGTDCELEGGCYSLMRMNLRALRASAKLDISLAELSLFSNKATQNAGGKQLSEKIGGQLATIYETSVQQAEAAGTKIDWKKIGQKIEAALISNHKAIK